MAKLTTNQGAPIGDNQNSRTAGQNGPTLLEDYQLLEKLAHFDRERIPERVVHARGAGAHGVFKVINSMKRYTKAAFLQKRRTGNAGIRPVFHGNPRSAFPGNAPGPARFRGQILHGGRQL